VTHDADAPTSDSGGTGGSTESAGNLLALFAAILLGLAATLTAVSAYKAALRDGEVLQSFNQSTQALTEATQLNAQGNQVYALDQQFFSQYVTLLQTPGQEQVGEYLRSEVMRPELVEAVDWWIDAPDAVTAFDKAPDNPYFVQEYLDADELETESKDEYDEAVELDENGDQFELATVLLALTLFFAGIATLFRRRAMSWGLLGVGTLALGAGAVTLVGALTAM
jgi:hypothetical protein